MAPWSFRNLNSWGGRARFDLFLLCGYAYALMQCLCNHASEDNLNGRENSKLHDLQRQNVFEDLASRFRFLLGIMEPKAESCQRHCSDICQSFSRLPNYSKIFYLS